MFEYFKRRDVALLLRSGKEAALGSLERLRFVASRAGLKVLLLLVLLQPHLFFHTHCSHLLYPTHVTTPLHHLCRHSECPSIFENQTLSSVMQAYRAGTGSSNQSTPQPSLSPPHLQSPTPAQRMNREAIPSHSHAAAPSAAVSVSELHEASSIIPAPPSPSPAVIDMCPTLILILPLLLRTT